MVRSLLFLILSIPLIGFAQTAKFEFSLQDSLSKQAIAYASCQIKGTTSFDYSDGKGSIKISGLLSDTLLISCIGYQEKAICLGSIQNTKILLQKQEYILNEVVVTNEKEESRLHNFRIKGKRNVSYSTAFKSIIVSRYHSSQFPGKMLKELRFKLKRVANKQHPDNALILRLQIFEEQPDKRVPGESLLKESIVITIDPTKTKQYKFDMHAQPLLLSEESYYIGVEYIGMQNGNKEFVNGPRYKFACVEPASAGETYIMALPIEEWLKQPFNFSLDFELGLEAL